MKTFVWDMSKPYHKQDIYVMARTALRNGYDVIIGCSQTGEHKYIQAGNLPSLKSTVAVSACLDEYVDQLTIKEV